MLVLIPSQQQDVMRAWDGLPGLLANLPIVGRLWAIAIAWLVVGKGLGWRTWLKIWAGKEINWDLVKQGLGLRAWPNIWAGREIVPELVGPLQAQDVAEQVAALLADPAQLQQMRQDLQQIRGETDAASNLVALVQKALAKSDEMPLAKNQ
jgi:lipid-A-disaccharide synthase